MKLTLPTSIEMGEYKKDTKKNKIGDNKKPFSLNLNVFRNASSFLIKSADTKFREYIKDNYPELSETKYNKIGLIYTVYFGNNRRRDLMNVGAVVDKFTCDSLTEMGVIEDDDYTHVPIFCFKAVRDIGNKRCEVIIVDLEKEDFFEILKENVND